MSKLAFVAVWLVVGLGSWLGYQAAHPGGTSGQAQPARLPIRLAPAHREPPLLTISSIFASQPPSLAGYDHRQIRTLIATGDVIPARSVNYKMVTYNDFLYPFRTTYPFLRQSDLTLINLESPLIRLVYAGVKVACTANNHIGNYGDSGIAETWSHLRAAGIGYCGLGHTYYRTVRGLRFAFLAYNCVGPRFDYAQARREIRAASKTGAAVIVSVHWGKEYVALPTTEPGIADDDPQRVAHWIVDSGADLVIGNHPHHVQALELYHNHLITYAHGNFIFDQMFSDETREGVVGVYTFYGRRLVSVRYRPVFIYDYAQPRWATPAQDRAILNGMRAATAELARRHKSAPIHRSGSGVSSTR